MEQGDEETRRSGKLQNHLQYRHHNSHHHHPQHPHQFIALKTFKFSNHRFKFISSPWNPFKKEVVFQSKMIRVTLLRLKEARRVRASGQGWWGKEERMKKMRKTMSWNLKTLRKTASYTRMIRPIRRSTAKGQQRHQTLSGRKKIPSFVAGSEKPGFNHGVMSVLYLKPFWCCIEPWIHAQQTNLAVRFFLSYFFFLFRSFCIHSLCLSLSWVVNLLVWIWWNKRSHLEEF